MPLIDFILDIAALLLWLNWLAVHFDPLLKTSSVSIVGTLKRANPGGQKRWVFLAVLAALLLVRAVIYWQICGSFHWTLHLDLGIIDLPFRSDYFLRMLLYSFLSFGIVFVAFYLWLLVLSVVNRNLPDTDGWQKLVRVYFRRLERWPAFIKVLLPFLLAGACWLALQPLLSTMGIVPRVKSFIQLLEQAALIGAGSYLAAKYLVVGVLLLHLLNSYVYLGNHTFWNFVNVTARNILYPLRWLPVRVGKFDFLPLIGIALFFLVAEIFARLPVWFYLPF